MADALAAPGGRRGPASVVDRSRPGSDSTRSTAWSIASGIGTMLAAIPRSALVLTFVADGMGLLEHRTDLAHRAGVLAGIGVALVGDAADPMATAGLSRAGPACGRNARSCLVRGRLGRPGHPGRMARRRGLVAGTGTLGRWAKRRGDSGLPSSTPSPFSRLPSYLPARPRPPRPRTSSSWAPARGSGQGRLRS